MNVFIIGSGNIASHLTEAFTKNGIEVSGIYSRNAEEGHLIAKTAKTIWYGRLKGIPKNADVYLICVSDDAIQEIAEQMPKSIKKSKIVAHTSGSRSIIETLDSCKNAGVFYPLQTFTKGKSMSYKSIPFCINGTSKKSIKKLSDLGSMVSKSVQVIDDSRRERIHLSAVMINNFVNHLIHASENLLAAEDIDPKILQPLLQETIRKQKSIGAYKAQTGPARRLDSRTLATHLDLLKRNKEYKAIYMAMSKSIQKTYKTKK